MNKNMDDHYFIQPSTSEAHTPSYYGTEMYPPTSSPYFATGVYNPVEGGQEHQPVVQNPYQNEAYSQIQNPVPPGVIQDQMPHAHSPASSGDLRSEQGSPQEGSGPPLKKRRKPSKATPIPGGPDVARVEENFDLSLENAASPTAKQDGDKPKKKRERQTANSIFCTFEDTTGNAVVCKQRAILGHKHCIRHILLDPEAPYQQCKHQRKPKNKKDLATQCTNAVRKDLGVDFCSTHLIMAGLKEAKKKPPALNAPASNEAPSTPEQHYSPGPGVVPSQMPSQMPVQVQVQVQQQQQMAPPPPHQGQMQQPQQIILIPQQSGQHGPMVVQEHQLMHPQMAAPTHHDGRQQQNTQYYPNTYAQHAQQQQQQQAQQQTQQQQYTHYAPPQQVQQVQQRPEQQMVLQHQNRGGPYQQQQQQQVFITTVASAPGQMPPQPQHHQMAHSALGRALASPEYHQQHYQQQQQGSGLNVEVHRSNEGLMEDSHLMKALISPSYQETDKAIFNQPYPEVSTHQQQQQYGQPGQAQPAQSGRRPGMTAPGPVVRTSSAPMPVQERTGGSKQAPIMMKVRKTSVPTPQVPPAEAPSTPSETAPTTLGEVKSPPKKRSRAKKPPVPKVVPVESVPTSSVADPIHIPSTQYPNQSNAIVTVIHVDQNTVDQTAPPEQSTTPAKIPSLPFQIKKGQQLTPEQCEQALSRIQEDPVTAAAFGKHRQMMAQRRAMAHARTTGRRRITTRRALEVKHAFSDRLDRILSRFDRTQREKWMTYLASLAANQIRVKGRASFPGLQQKMPHLANYICKFGKTPLPRPLGAKQAREQMAKVLSSAAPPIRPSTPTHFSSSSSDDDDDEESPNKMIVLRQKGQPKKIIGPHRMIPQVDIMSRLMEDADFDKTDLFPLGLEPSDDEDFYPGNTVMPVCGFNPLAKNGDATLELYLLKKQLRIEKYGLMKTAHLNAPLMNAAKNFPNSAGVALLQRNDPENQHPPEMLATAIRRCCKVEDKKRCDRSCLPMSNHCASHVLFNVNQRLFSFCTQSLCRRPVVSIDALLWDGKCNLHRDTYENKYGDYPEYADSDEEMDEEYDEEEGDYDAEEQEKPEPSNYYSQPTTTVVPTGGVDSYGTNYPVPANQMPQQHGSMEMMQMQMKYPEHQQYAQLPTGVAPPSMQPMTSNNFGAAYPPYPQTQTATYAQYMGKGERTGTFSNPQLQPYGDMTASIQGIFDSNGGTP